MNRSHRKRLGHETVEIINRGWYESATGNRIDMTAQMARCLSHTRLYTPAELDGLLRTVPAGSWDTSFEVRNETTLSAAVRHIVERRQAKTLCLNFASAKNPGGGFLSGSQAQEESLARASALYASPFDPAGLLRDESRQWHSLLHRPHDPQSRGTGISQ